MYVCKPTTTYTCKQLQYFFDAQMLIMLKVIRKLSFKKISLSFAIFSLNKYLLGIILFAEFLGFLESFLAILTKPLFAAPVAAIMQ